MTITFLAADAWKRLQSAASRAREPAFVAVAYFADKTASMLPLPTGSRLVVDASEVSVKSGRTCPAELRKMVTRGVRVFTVAELHAKVFVLGKHAFVGSTNVSRFSRDVLIEGLIETDAVRVVAATKRFVRELCLNELGPNELGKLQKLYHPPRFRGGSPKKRGSRARLRALPCMRIAHLDGGDPSLESLESRNSGRAAARKLMERPRGHELEEFWWNGVSSIRPGDLVLPVFEESDGRLMVEPPGKALHVRRWRTKEGKWKSWIFIERRPGRRIKLERLSSQIGRGAKKRLMRDGRLKAAIAERVQSMWNR